MFPRSAIAGVSEWVKIEIKNGLLLVDTEIGGIPGYALIDTGAELNAINEQFLASTDVSFQRGRKTKISGVHSTANRNTYKEVPVTIFGEELVFSDLVEVNIGSPEIHVIIGAGFLKLFIFQFDYPNQRMRMITRDSVDLEDLKNVESRRDRMGGSPLVRVRLNDEKDVWLTIDTGSNGGVFVDRSIAKKQKWLDRYHVVDDIAAGALSSGRIQRFNLPKMTFGPYEIENPLISVLLETYSPTRNVPASSLVGKLPQIRSKSKGLLGYDVLKHFVVTVDYKYGHVHVEPGSQLQGDEQTTTGVDVSGR